MSPIDEAIQHWRDDDIPLNAGASDGDAKALEQLLGVALPKELRTFYAIANGMPDFENDGWMVSFWSIERILREAEMREGTDELGRYRDLAFADVLISSWNFWLRVRTSESVSVWVEATDEEIASFPAFLDAYLHRPTSLCLCGTA